MIHHIAIGTSDPEKLKRFYSEIPGLAFEMDHFYEDGSLRSSWFLAGEIRIMIEKEKESKSPLALVFSALDSSMRKRIDEKFSAAFLDKTLFTKYFSDPDGNRLGFSSYPHPWEA